MADKVVILTTTGANTWSVPADWGAVNTIECIGSGGSGNVAGGGSGCVGGHGGTYAATTNLSLTPGGSASYNIGTGGGANDTWLSNTGSAPTTSSQGALAKPNQNTTTGCIGSTTFRGGSRGAGAPGGFGCGGGGGAASRGGRGGDSTTPTFNGNGKTAGGGGAGDANPGGDVVQAPQPQTGGIGGTAGGGNGANGSAWAGGAGTNGSAGTSFTATLGGTAGAGGGGSAAAVSTGGNGGLYGAGGGGSGISGTAGVGAQGCIIITYTPAVGGAKSYVWVF